MPIDLTSLDELWARWGVLAAVAAGIGWEWNIWVDGEGLQTDDAGGNVATLARLPVGRAVLWGVDHEYSDTVSDQTVTDVLGGAPAWIPWDRLVSLVPEWRLGFCRWWDGSSWGRATYDEEDGLRYSVPIGVGDDRRETLERLADLLKADPEQLETAFDAAVTAAVEGQLSAGELAKLVGSGDLAKAVATASAAGLSGGSPPELVPGPPPPFRERPRATEDDLRERLRQAMSHAVELSRPTPPETRQLRDLLKLLGKVAKRKGRPQLVAEAPASGWGVLLEPADDKVGTDEVVALVAALRRAESDPERGSWLYLRIALEHRGQHEITRAYDHLPTWWTRSVRDRQFVSRELEARRPEWRPAWAPLAGDDAAWEQVPCP